MRRFHLFELEDQPWFPALIRDAGTAYLEFVARTHGQTESLVPILSKALLRARENRIVDLCSGGSGPLPTILARIASEESQTITATLTDLYPNREAFERATRENPGISAIYDPIDATAVPSHLKGVRTLFSGFHHFRPEEAKRILTSAVDAGESIAVFEVVARHPFALFAMSLVPLLTLLSIPFLRPFRLGWIPLTYVIPVIPLFIFWDGMVSCLRCYSQDELREMTADLDSNDYKWEIGSIKLAGAPFYGSYMIGSPTRRSGP